MLTNAESTINALTRVPALQSCYCSQVTGFKYRGNRPQPPAKATPPVHASPGLPELVYRNWFSSRPYSPSGPDEPWLAR